MFNWYSTSKICFAFLEDVSIESVEEELPKARWFTRGWTLQELLAPSYIIFFDSEWRRIGIKSTDAQTEQNHDLHFMHQISNITGIQVKSLMLPKSLFHESIACRMSWAAKGPITRIEDIAYCLMGIFRVNMPLLYVEGINAFRRLQEEILKTSNDHSILIWGALRGTDWNRRSCFATSPKYFEDHGDIVPFGKFHAIDTLTLTNKGLEVKLTILKINGDSIAILPCHIEDDLTDI